MRNLFHAIALITILIITSCSKDENQNEFHTEEFEVGEVTLNLSTLFIDKGDLGNKQILNASICGEWPVMPSVNTNPTLFTIIFSDPEGTSDSIIFENVDISSGNPSFQIPLKLYDVDVTSIGGNALTLEPHFRGYTSADFKITPVVNITVSPSQAWYLIDASDINIDTIQFTEIVDGFTEPSTGNFYSYGTDWIGGFIGVFNYIESYEVIISFEDTRGTPYTTTISNPNKGEVYRIQVCPESETGISVQEGGFENFNDTSL